MSSSLDYVMHGGDGTPCPACGVSPACPSECDGDGVVAPRCLFGPPQTESAVSSPGPDVACEGESAPLADAAAPAPTPVVVVHNAEAMLREALAAHSRGWPLTPLNGKKPMLKHWQKRGMPSREQVEVWAAQRNLGALTGSASGFVVIDDDTDDQSGASTLKLPKTVTAITGSGKRHYYFKAPQAALKNSASKLGAGIDVRADGGQIVLPGSTHPETGALYSWLEGRDPDSIEIASFPMHLMDMLRPKKRGRLKVTAQDRTEPRAVKTLHRLCADVAMAVAGTRNDTLNKSAYTAAGFIASGELDLAHATSELRAAGLQSGLDSAEVEGTLQSGLQAGLAAPFDRASPREGTGIALQGATADPAVPTRATRKRPEIKLVGGELPKIASACQDVLLGLATPLVFQRGGTLVRVLRSDPGSMREVQNATLGRLHSIEITPDWLRTVLTDFATIYRLDKKSGEWFPVDCPTSIAKVLLDLSGWWRFPSLLTITNVPTLRTDGSVLEEPGYDRATTIYLDPGNVKFPRVPDAPTSDDARAALEQLKYVLKDFPFATPADRSVILAAILTALVRPMLRAAPLFGISAPKMASGKSLLADIIAMIATGRVGQAMPQGKDEDEERKRLLAILKEGDPVAVIDNVERPLGGGALCAALTQEVYRDRILGSTRTVSFPTCVTWIATGNNLVVEGDLTTRVLICRLDAEVERPEERKFEIDPRRYVSENRAALVIAGLTVLRAYVVAGHPKQELVHFGRFEDFSHFVRSALVWLGEADPCEVRTRIEDADPERQIHVEIMAAWLEVFGPESVTASDVVLGVERRTVGVEGAHRLHELLSEVAGGTAGALSARRLGIWLASKRDRIEGSMRIVQIGQRHRSNLWAVVAPRDCDAMKSPSAALERSPQTHKTHRSDQVPPLEIAPRGEPCESWGPNGPSWTDNARKRVPMPLGLESLGESGTLVGNEQCDDGNRASTGLFVDGWPTGPCYQCHSPRFWRPKNAGHGLAGDPRCLRCHPQHPPEHLVEFFDLEGGAA